MKLKIDVVVYDDSWNRLAVRNVILDDLANFIDVIRVGDGTGRQITGLIEAVAYQIERESVPAGTDDEVECE